ncbi:hypothetical protein BDR06DRAFT_972977 [Suillus hirtellus]|nr:hypothetical protein BDR06DRAFT_972977 [Suillus hirtellus]
MAVQVSNAPFMGEKWIKAYCAYGNFVIDHFTPFWVSDEPFIDHFTHFWVSDAPFMDAPQQALIHFSPINGALDTRKGMKFPRHCGIAAWLFDIERTEIVGDLKEVIKDKKRPEFDHVATDCLELWKVDLPIDEMIEHNLNNLTLDPMKSLPPVDEIIEIFPDTPLRKYLHIIVQCLPAVDIEWMKTVSDLKNVIKVTKKPEFDHVATNHLELWKVKINLNDMDLQNVILDGGVELCPLTELSDVFADGIECGCIHIVIKHPAIARHIPAVDQRIAYLKKGTGTPSASAKPSAFSTKQDQQEYLCNHPHRATDPVPITLLEPIFAEFMDDCHKYEPTVHDNDFVLQLSEKMASFHPNELAQMNTFQQVLWDYGIILNASMVGSTGCTTDRHLLSTNGQFVLMIIEGKNKIRSGAAEPFMEVMLYYRKFMEDLKVEIARLWSFIPCIHIIVFGSVFTEKVQSDVLISIIPLFWHSTDLHMQVMAAHTFGALKIAVKKLTKLYSHPIPSLEPEDPYLKCPYPQSYTNSTGEGTTIQMLQKCQHKEFSYDETQILRDWLIFFGETIGNVAGIKICMKFVRHYSPQAHEFCASKGNTPKLIAYNSLPSSWNMLLKETITCLIRELHNHDDSYMHGDLQDTNFIVRDDKHFMLLNFDWAGLIQKTHYPIAWDGQKMVAEHDLDMLSYLFHPEQDVQEPAAKHRHIYSEGSLMVI